MRVSRVRVEASLSWQRSHALQVYVLSQMLARCGVCSGCVVGLTLRWLPAGVCFVFTLSSNYR